MLKILAFLSVLVIIGSCAAVLASDVAIGVNSVNNTTNRSDVCVSDSNVSLSPNTIYEHDESSKIQATTEIDNASANMIYLSAVSFDSSKGEPSLPSNLSIPQYPVAIKGYYIVQFAGLVNPEWKEKLVYLNCEICDYVPDNAFIVRMPAETKEIVQDLDFVQWIGIYQPAYKISPELPIKDEKAKINITVLLFRPENREKISSALEELGGEVLKSSGDLIRLRINASKIGDIAKINDVEWIEEYIQPQISNDVSRWVIQSYVNGSTPIWEHNITGAGQIVGISDSGLDYDGCFFWDSVNGAPPEDSGLPSSVTPDYNQRKVIVYHDVAEFGDYDDDYPGHGTHTSGSIAGDNLATIGSYDTNDGMAYNAKLVFQDLGQDNSSYIYPPADLNDLFQQAYDDGARIHSNSWGSNAFGAYTTDSKQCDEFMWNHKDFLILFANGNDGPYSDTVDSPATAKNVVSVGATENGVRAENMAYFSSHGPTDDGRIKPTVCAPGVNIWSADSDGDIASYNCDVVSMSGTSMSTPTTAGAAALIRQYFVDGYYPTGNATPDNSITPGAALIKAMLVNSGEEMSGLHTEGPIPSNGQGWGRILLDNALYFDGDSRRLEVYDSDSVNTGQSKTYNIAIDNQSEPLEITLVWTDYPSTPAAAINMVNDLNLFVTGPGGIYSTSDNRNVVESVYIKTPPVGAYTITVTGYNVPEGPQPFALVITGGLGIGSKGIVYLDNDWYNCSSIVNVTVKDADLNVDNTTVEKAYVNIMSFPTEITPENITLTETGVDTATFTGSIRLTTSAPVPDGNLSVSHGDLITVFYTDADDGTGNPVTVHDTATVDCIAPVITVATPQNNTTYSSNSVALNYSVNEKTDWEGYSLDGQPIVIISGNTTLTNLTDGWHNVTVFASDIAGNVGASDKIWFNITTPDIWVYPEAFEVILPQGNITNRTLTIGNNGTGMLEFEISDVKGTTIPYSLVPIGQEYESEKTSGTKGIPAKYRIIPTSNQSAQATDTIKVLILSGGHSDDTPFVASDFSTHMTDIYFEPYFANNQTPTLEYLQQFDIVLLYENGLFANSPNVGNAVYDYVLHGGNAVIGTFYWQDRSDNTKYNSNGWGNLENIDPFTSDTQGCEYNYDEMDPATIVAHPITNGVNTLWANSYRGGVSTKPGTAVLAYWKTTNYLGELDPLVGCKELEGMQRLAALSIFPAYGKYGYGSEFGGDFYTLWENALKWAARGGVDWLTEYPQNGTIAPSNQKNITVTINATDLNVGKYNATIIIKSNDPNENPVKVPVHLIVTQLHPPDIWVEPKSFNITLQQDKVKYENLTIGNNGTGDLAFNISVSSTLPSQLGEPKVFFNDTFSSTTLNTLNLVSTSGSSGVNNEFDNKVQKTETSDMPPANLIPNSIYETEHTNAGVTKFLIIDHGMDKKYFVNYSYVTIYESYFSTLPTSEMMNYDVIYFEPSWSNYANLKSNMANLQEYVKSGGVAVINIAGNIGSAYDIDPAGTDYNRDYTHESETIRDPSHAYITGQPYGGTKLTESDFDSWSSSDHGYLYGYPNNAEIVLSNVHGTSWIHYTYGSGDVVTTTLTYGWGSRGARGTPLDNLIKYAFYISGEVAVDWLSVTPTSGVVPPRNQTNLTVEINATSLEAGAYNATIIITHNDILHDTINVPVNLMVFSAPHDIAVTNITAPDSTEINSTIVINSTISNLGSSDESNITVDFIVDGITQSNKTIPYLASSASTNVRFKWTAPGTPGMHNITIYAEPVPGENITWNNQLSKNISVVTIPDIWVYPEEFYLTLEKDEVVNRTLTVGNNGTNTLNASISALLPTDVDLDDEQEIIVRDCWGYTYVVNNSNLDTFNGWEWRSPYTDSYKGFAIADVNADAIPDLLEGGNNYLRVYDVKNNRVLYSNLYTGGSRGGTAAGDIDNDGVVEMLVSDYDGYIYVYDGKTGLPDAEGHITYPTANYGTGLGIGDIDNDGVVEVIRADRYGIDIFNGQTRALERAISTPSLDYYPDLVFDDVNGNGIAEIYVGGEYGNVYAYEWNGVIVTILWESLGLGNNIRPCGSADADNDGDFEVFVADSSGYLYALDASTGITEGSVYTGYSSYTYCAIGDIDKDRTLEIATGNYDGYIRTYTYNNGSFTLEKKSVTDYGSDLGRYTDSILISGAKDPRVFNIFDFVKLSEKLVSVGPGNWANITVTVNATNLEVREYNATIIIESNDPDEGTVNIPVNLNVIPHDHDIAVTSIEAPNSTEINSTIFVNGTVCNLGLNDEYDIIVNFIVDGVNQSNKSIPSIESGNCSGVSFEWTVPNITGTYNLTIYAEPVPGENINWTWNNQLSRNISVITIPDIWVYPEEYDLTLEKGRVDNRTLTIGNNGTGILNTSLSTSPPTDIDLDNEPEIIVRDCWGYTYVVNNTNLDTFNGSEWRSPYTDSYKGFAIADVNGDGIPDLLEGGYDYLRVYDVKNNRVLYSNLYTGGSRGGTAAGDIDNDGVVEMLVSDYDGYIYVYDGKTGLPDAQGHISYPTPYYGTGLGIGDIDSDGVVEVIRVDRYGLDIFNGQTRALEREISIPSLYGYPDIVFGDANNDGIAEIYVGGEYGYIYAYEWNGVTATQLWRSWDLGSYTTPCGFADADNDGDFEVFIGNNSGYITALNALTGSIEGSVFTGYYSYVSCAVGDIDKDGVLEIATGNYDGYIRTYSYDNGRFTLEKTSVTDYGSDLGRYTDSILISGAKDPRVFKEVSFIQFNETEVSVLPDSSHNVTVIFNTTNLNEGAYNTNIVINSNDPDESIVNVPVNLRVITPPHIVSFSPADLTPTQYVGTTNTFSVITDQVMTSNEWYLLPGGITTLGNGTSSQTLTWSYSDIGIHNITYVGSNPNGSVNKTWIVTVMAINETRIFDTGPGTYPSIFGTHNGTIIPNATIKISTLYTYPCPGTGGHTVSIELYENNTLIARGTWDGYRGDWHNITIQNLTGGAPYVTLLENHNYNYTICTGSYPLIIHAKEHEAKEGGKITCSEFIDANGKKYTDWIPAIKLFL